jgi:hypothetical protein
VTVPDLIPPDPLTQGLLAGVLAAMLKHDLDHHQNTAADDGHLAQDPSSAAPCSVHEDGHTTEVYHND